MPAGERTIPEGLVAYLESGISVMVGTRGVDLRPTALRAAGAKVHADGRRIDVFLPRATSQRGVADVRATGRAAVSFSRPIDHLSIQLKGPARVREAREDERAVVEAYREAFCEQLEIIGLPRTLVGRFAAWPTDVLEIEVTAIFTQTPGPTAGTPLAAEAAR